MITSLVEIVSDKGPDRGLGVGWKGPIYGVRAILWRGSGWIQSLAHGEHLRSTRAPERTIFHLFRQSLSAQCFDALCAINVLYSTT